MAKVLNDPTLQQYDSFHLAGDLLAFTIERKLFSTDAILKKLLNHVRQSMGMEIAFVSEIFEGRRVFRYVDYEGDFRPFQVEDSDPVDETYCLRIIDGRLPELILDTSQNSITAGLTATAAYSIGNYIGVPIIFSDNTVYGTFCCFSRQPDHTLSARDVENLRFLAHCAGLVIEKDIGGLRGYARKHRLIKNVIDESQFFPVFQPIFDLQSNQVSGFEALTRFIAKPRKTPEHWFQEASNVGLQQDLEMAALTAAMEALPGPLKHSISVNLSPESLMGNQQSILQALPRDQTLVIEITEHDVIEDYALVNRALALFREKGIKLAVDDVGAGFACLKHILLLKPDIIKIDQAIVKSIDGNRDAQAITRAMVTFAQEIQCDVIAEGVETAEELACLKQLGVAKGQGFLLGVPNKGAISRWV
ncbi:sensor domain-containing phosphodiesterase [Halioxenophilus aromaticivorans]|uniref:EAL domain-containing protein n=1 Tax=Halioxenophilus aromaticivorans TaxID=1306992 RepID=A0AAV3U2Y9_9ALTE